ncbi:hypothetical protein WDW89_20585 [Deltaproteobacteria bacterium TL4]
MAEDLDEDVIHNKDLFGGTFNTLSPEKGVMKVKIRAGTTGHVPGMTSHWKFEVETRVQDIKKNAQPPSFVSRALTVFSKRNLSDKASGKELLNLHQAPETQKLFNQLAMNPLDPRIRGELVWNIAKTKKNLSVESCRVLLIQICVACSLDPLTTINVNRALKIQAIYLSKLSQFLVKEVDNLSLEIEKIQSEASSKPKQVKLTKTRDDLRRNNFIIQQYLQSTKNASNELKLPDLEIKVQTLLTEMIGSQDLPKGSKSATDLGKVVPMVIQALQNLPALFPLAHKMVDQVIQAKPNGVINYYLKAKLLRNDMDLKIKYYEMGEQTPELRKDIQECFKQTHEVFYMAIKLVPRLNQNRNHVMVLVEYGKLIHYFYRTCLHTLGIRLPRPWLQTIFNKTMELLSTASDNAQASSIIGLIRQDMAEENLL